MPGQGTLTQLAGRWVDLLPEEMPAALWAFAYFFCLLSSYYLLRPLRDEMGVEGGVGNLQWVFTATFVVMLFATAIFGWASSRCPRRRLVPRVYALFAASLVVFFLLFESDEARSWVARAFFVWVSVFNLFVVSVFWSFMADLFSSAEARRLFPVVAAGGSTGALAGPGLAAALSATIRPDLLLLFSTLLLLCAIVCVHGLLRCRTRRAGAPTDERPALHGRALAGIFHALRSPYLLGICGFMLLFTALSTFLYFEQAHIVRAASGDPARRTALFAAMDLATNGLTVLGQLFIAGRFIARFGLAPALMLLPAFVAAGFLVLGLYPLLGTLVAFQVLRRAGNFALTRPAREVLFTVISAEDKYKAKNFIDTVIYRGGDAASGWLFAALSAVGLGIAAIALVAVPVALLWMALGAWLGRAQERLALKQKAAASLTAAASSTNGT